MKADKNDPFQHLRDAASELQGFDRMTAGVRSPARTEFGLFGLDFVVTKRMMNRLLKPYGLKLKVKGARKWGDQSEVSIERV